MVDFLIIGGMKCGTTSLYEYLSNHRDIQMSSNKEPGFFCDWQKNDINWYESFFPQEVGGNELWGEASTHYSKYPIYKNVPHNIFSYNKKIKIIYLVRDPISRIISHYKFNRSKNKENKKIDNCIDIKYNNPYISYSRYDMQIKQYDKYFDRDQIIVVKSEELKEKRHKEVKRVLDFLGVGSSVPKSIDKEFNSTAEATRREGWSNALAKVRWLQRLYGAFPSSVRTRLKPLYRSKVVDPTIGRKEHARLVSFFEPGVEWLSSYTGQTFDDWL